ncbi:MAG: ATP-binding protein [Bacteroidales bacterium]|nr:ATP-binding protein [Bacteroidales bacterium]
MDRNIIIRPHYIEAIKQGLAENMIVVLTGQRRVGKSWLLDGFKLVVEAEGPCNCIRVDKEDLDFDFILTYTDLHQYIKERIASDRPNYILIDEVQEIEEFEKALRHWRKQPNCFLVVTGSNAKMLSSEISTLLGGRYREVYVQALSYKEFLEFHNLEDNDASLLAYINFGGMPSLRNVALNESLTRTILTDIFNTALLKDVILRNKIRNPSLLENIARFLADTTGKLVSANNISKRLSANGVNSTPGAVISYLKMLCEAYIVKRVPRYDIHGKKLLEQNEKFYFEDHGIRNVLLGSDRAKDIERVLETIVLQELIRRGYKVNVGQLPAGEIDFVATDGSGDKLYIQVTYLLSHPETMEREFGALRRIEDNYPKYVISLSPMLDRSVVDGIIHLPLRQFLMKGLNP